MEWSEIEKQAASLSTAVDDLLERFTGVTFPDEMGDVCGLALGLLRVMLAHARVIVAVGDAEYVDATGSNLRSMLEAYGELNYLLSQPNLNEAAVQSAVFGLLEYRDFLTERNDFDAIDRQKVDSQIAVYETRYPDVVARVRKERDGKQRPLFWSGSRKKLLELAGQGRSDPKSFARLYRVLSWDTHHILTAALEVHVTEEGDSTHVQYGPKIAPRQQGALNRYAATGLLADAWDLITTRLPIQKETAE